MSGKTFEVLASGSSPFVKTTQEAISMLESITAADRGRAVPYFSIWEINKDTGKPKNTVDGETPISPLSFQLREPPRFGGMATSTDERFRERPPVSLETITIHTNNPRGTILYRTIDLSFMVHRPDVIFADEIKNEDSWSSLMVPGRTFALRYGWSSSGVVNGILNGTGADEHGKRQLPGRSTINFTVTNYSFQIHPDNQIQIGVQAIESGEFNLRRAVPCLTSVFGKDIVTRTDKKRSSKKNVAKRDRSSVDVYDGRNDGLRDVLQKRLKAKADSSEETGNAKRGQEKMISFKGILDAIISDTIVEALSDVGYDASKIDLNLGYFNKRAGSTTKKHGSRAMGGDIHHVGEFLFPLSDVNRMIADVMAKGEQMTLYNFIERFLEVINSAASWTSEKSATDDRGDKVQLKPVVVMRLLPMKDGMSVIIFDREREITRLIPEANAKKDFMGGSSENIKQYCLSCGVPFISLMKGNSYISTVSFEVTQDPLIKTIFMKRYASPDRSQITGNTSEDVKKNSAIDPRKFLYSSAITGELSVVGNFALDVFGLVWLDFGTRAKSGLDVWSGPFYVLERDDVLSSADFVVKIRLQAAGDDPLDTQGRKDFVELKKQIDAADDKNKGNKDKGKKKK